MRMIASKDRGKETISHTHCLSSVGVGWGTVVGPQQSGGNLEWSCLDGLTPDVADTCSLAIDLCPLASGFHYFKVLPPIAPPPPAELA